MKGIISKAFIFDEPLLQEELEDFKWEFRNRGKNWEHFFNQYGMNKITKNDFIHLLSFKPGYSKNQKKYPVEWMRKSSFINGRREEIIE